jgi:hypothetical protein
MQTKNSKPVMKIKEYKNEEEREKERMRIEASNMNNDKRCEGMHSKKFPVNNKP